MRDSREESQPSSDLVIQMTVSCHPALAPYTLPASQVQVAHVLAVVCPSEDTVEVSL